MCAKVRQGGGFCTEVLMESKIGKILISKINFVNSRVSAILQCNKMTKDSWFPGVRIG